MQAKAPQAPRPVCDQLLALLREAEAEVAQLVGAPHRQQAVMLALNSITPRPEWHYQGAVQ